MSVMTSWNTRPLDAAVRRWKRKGLTDASRHLKGAIQDSLSVEGHPRYRRSHPGEAPRFETKDLLRSWVAFVSPSLDAAEVYSSLDYSYYLEVGSAAHFGTILPRPYIRVTLLAEEVALRILLTQDLP